MFILFLSGIGAIAVWIVATLLRFVGIFVSRSGARFALAHTLIIIIALAISPLVIMAQWGSPYGDIYWPFLFVPGVHIDYPIHRWLSGPLFHWLLGHAEPFLASVLTVIVVPGLIGLLVGGAQWWLIGSIWDSVSRRRNPHQPAGLS